MTVELITKEDLNKLKTELLDTIRELLHVAPAQPKQWLKSSDVRKMLNISPGTLQNLRINGTLPFTQMGGAMYYKYEDIQAILEGNKKHNKLDVGR